jgi:hypothetical protein
VVGRSGEGGGGSRGGAERWRAEPRAMAWAMRGRQVSPFSVLAETRQKGSCPPSFADADLLNHWLVGGDHPPPVRSCAGSQVSIH